MTATTPDTRAREQSPSLISKRAAGAHSPASRRVALLALVLGPRADCPLITLQLPIFPPGCALPAIPSLVFFFCLRPALLQLSNRDSFALYHVLFGTRELLDCFSFPVVRLFTLINTFVLPRPSTPQTIICQKKTQKNLRKVSRNEPSRRPLRPFHSLRASRGLAFLPLRAHPPSENIRVHLQLSITRGDNGRARLAGGTFFHWVPSPST